MHIPNIDLSEAARSYGLSYVPEVVHTFDDDMTLLFQGDPEAAFDRNDRNIHVFPMLFEPVDDYDERRFASVGIGPLDTRGKVQFVLAHELWHARQEELYGDDYMGKVSARTLVSTAAHDGDPAEQDADKHAAQVYTQIKIGD